MATIYKIHPAIGVARVGSSSEFYIAPETGGGLPTDPATGQPVTSFRDSAGDLLKQAQRFRVFSYDDTNPNDPGTEVVAGSGGVAAIEWTVYLANKKACWYQFEQLTGSGMEGDAGYIANGPSVNPLRNFLVTDPAARQAFIIDPGPRTVGGSGNPTSADFTVSGDFSNPALTKPYPITTLGSIQLDANGNLLVLAGNGASGTTNLHPTVGVAPPPPPPLPPSTYEYVLTTYPNNDGWFDDVSDGPVTANLVLTDGTQHPVDVPAWCLGGPPKYAPQIVNQVTLYDAMYDIAVRKQNYNPALYANRAFNPQYQVDFDNEVAPILARPDAYQWVAEIPPQGVSQHVGITQDAGPDFPQYILRSPAVAGGTNLGVNLMPKLAGDNPISDTTMSKYLTLTQTQYFLIQQWVNGIVLPACTTRPPLSPAAALDRAALENCVGGAFCPGIEMTWICRNTTIYSDTFRIRHAPNPQQGHLSQTNGDNNDYSGGLEPGDIVKYMAQPWQADFNECSNQPINPDPNTNILPDNIQGVTFWWWPAERPFFFYPSVDNPAGEQLPWTRGFYNDPNNATVATPNLGDMQMVVNWKDLGFIVLQQGPTGPQYLEIERNTAAIDAYTPPGPAPQAMAFAVEGTAAARATGRTQPRAIHRPPRIPPNLE
ncbi:MAG TPA: LodA/GoxA family CTQ-dependent oxidase [Thermoanaerobaculia bacterium]|jgi:hypothetical protein|nr:LodA/GoxA family CTQ-dependent oxidase [Thermoanaerobaculia bacterium]